MKIVPCQKCERLNKAGPSFRSNCTRYQFRYSDGRFEIKDIPEMIKALTDFLNQLNRGKHAGDTLHQV